MSFDRLVKRIDKKDWLFIREKWLENIPNLIPGEPPGDQIAELPFLQSELDNIGFNQNRKLDILGLRESIFHEGVFLCHKGHAAGRASSWNHNSGIYSWSISSAYQSSFFLAKSFLCFVGITLPKYANFYYLVDSLPEPEKLSSNERKLGKKPHVFTKVEKIGALQHYNVWQILQRVLNTMKNPPFQEILKDIIMSLDTKEFAKQRNLLHYKNNHWEFLEDLLDKVYIVNFCSNKPSNLSQDIHPDIRQDFSSLLMVIMLKLNHSLLDDLSILTRAFEEDYKLLKKSLVEIPEYQLI